METTKSPTMDELKGALAKASSQIKGVLGELELVYGVEIEVVIERVRYQNGSSAVLVNLSFSLAT